jgi:transcriptional regulator with XRE-family HTH domain
MARKWTEIRKTLTPEKEERIKRRVQEELVRLPLYELREARKLTQTNLAKVLDVNQAAISKLEKRTDMYLSTLRSYVEAMGGTLELRAVFADREVIIEQLREPETEELELETSGVGK